MSVIIYHSTVLYTTKFEFSLTQRWKHQSHKYGTLHTWLHTHTLFGWENKNLKIVGIKNTYKECIVIWQLSCYYTATYSTWNCTNSCKKIQFLKICWHKM